MLSYSSYKLTAVAALLVTCHALNKCPGIYEPPDIPGRDGLKGLPQVPVFALNGKIKEVGNKVFATNGKKVDFASALRSCEEAGGTLATPMNEEENKAIMDIVKQYKQYAYLGIKHCETSGQFMDITGRSLSYTKWHQHEPNGKGTEKCVEMYMDGSWNDKKCNVYRLTVCEF